MTTVKEKFDAEWDAARAELDRMVRRQTSAAPAAATATIEHSNPGGPVSFFGELKADGRAFLTKLESVDETALSDFEAVLANPKTAGAFALIRQFTHVDPGPVFDGAMAVLQALAPQAAAVPAAVPSDPVPSFTPAGPQVGGQA